jgi:hypothetical protein
LEEVLIQQEGRYFAGGFAGFITQSENVSFENMKNAIIYPFVSRNLGQKE